MGFGLQVEGEHGFFVDAPTIACANLHNNALILQVHAAGARLLDGVVCKQQLAWPSVEPAIMAVAAAIVEPYCVALLSDGSLQLLSFDEHALRMTQTNRAAPSDASCYPEAICLFAETVAMPWCYDMRTTDKTVLCAVARCDGVIEIHILPDWQRVYCTPSVFAIPMLLHNTDNDPLTADKPQYQAVCPAPEAEPSMAATDVANSAADGGAAPAAKRHRASGAKLSVSELKVLCGLHHCTLHLMSLSGMKLH